MEVILKQDMANLGYKDDVISVKNGYARNFLIPQGFAINATVAAKRQHTEILKQRQHKEEKILVNMEHMILYSMAQIVLKDLKDRREKNGWNSINTHIRERWAIFNFHC